MKTAGIIRRIDDLGRIVIPKEIRQQLKIQESEPMAIYLAKDTIIIKKVTTDNFILRKSENWTELINPRGAVIAKGHTLYPEDILKAMNANYSIEEIEEIEDE